MNKYNLFDNDFDEPSVFDDFFDSGSPLPPSPYPEEADAAPPMDAPDGHRDRLRSMIHRSRLEDMKPLQVMEFLLGAVLPRQDTQPVARSVMDYFDWDLRRVLRGSLDDFMQIPGMGETAAQWMDLLCRSVDHFFQSEDAPGIEIANYRQLRRFCRRLYRYFGHPACLMLLTDDNHRLMLCLPLVHGTYWNNREVILNAASTAAGMHAANAYIAVFTKSVYRHPNRSDLAALDLYLKVMQYTYCAPRDVLFMDHFHCSSLRTMRKMPQIDMQLRNVKERDAVNPPGTDLILRRLDENGSHPVRIPISELEVEENHERPEPV